MRNLSEVLEAMMDAVPFIHAEEFWHELNRIKNSVQTAAPEMMHFWWRETSRALADYLPEDEKDHNEWQQKVVRIWQGKG